MTSVGARRLNKESRDVRRKRFSAMRERFLKDHPRKNPFKLIAVAEGITIWTVYSVFCGRR